MTKTTSFESNSLMTHAVSTANSFASMENLNQISNSETTATEDVVISFPIKVKVIACQDTQNHSLLAVDMAPLHDVIATALDLQTTGTSRSIDYYPGQRTGLLQYKFQTLAYMTDTYVTLELTYDISLFASSEASSSSTFAHVYNRYVDAHSITAFEAKAQVAFDIAMKDVNGHFAKNFENVKVIFHDIVFEQYTIDSPSSLSSSSSSGMIMEENDHLQRNLADMWSYPEEDLYRSDYSMSSKRHLSNSMSSLETTQLLTRNDSTSLSIFGTTLLVSTVFMITMLGFIGWRMISTRLQQDKEHQRKQKEYMIPVTHTRASMKPSPTNPVDKNAVVHNIINNNNNNNDSMITRMGLSLQSFSSLSSLSSMTSAGDRSTPRSTSSSSSTNSSRSLLGNVPINEYSYSYSNHHIVTNKNGFKPKPKPLMLDKPFNYDFDFDDMYDEESSESPTSIATSSTESTVYISDKSLNLDMDLINSLDNMRSNVGHGQPLTSSFDKENSLNHEQEYDDHKSMRKTNAKRCEKVRIRRRKVNTSSSSSSAATATSMNDNEDDDHVSVIRAIPKPKGLAMQAPRNNIKPLSPPKVSVRKSSNHITSSPEKKCVIQIRLPTDM